MVQDYWVLGEKVQDAILEAGYEAKTVEGIAVDLHDLLQAADRIRTELAPDLLNGVTAEKLDTLRSELEHIRWHCDAGSAFLREAQQAISQLD
jgi:hypothetical protein